ncbi:hypothetical protein J4461_03060 [Candidatus Pacearchaeota archaeon]|nr:hypothetical protein [Candidatus Pacearchaeota archaeon]
MSDTKPILSATGLNRDYLIALGSVEHYLKRVEQIYEESLPGRWIHLAERTLTKRPVQRYTEYLNSIGCTEEIISDSNRDLVSELDKMVDEINRLSSEDNVHLLKLKESQERRRLQELYNSARNLILTGRTDYKPREV